MSDIGDVVNGGKGVERKAQNGCGDGGLDEFHGVSPEKVNIGLEVISLKLFNRASDYRLRIRTRTRCEG